MNICEVFENQVVLGLEKCNYSLEKIKERNKAVGIAVSGGADSISLLISLCNILKSIPIKVITVNHFIRPKEETCADVAFVMEICQKLREDNYNVSCFVEELLEGQVEELAQKEKIGIEGAARKLRYASFERFIENNNLQFLCLAHNKNDQIETLLMRFLQGASIQAMLGIPCVRDKFIRPLLNISRNQIEEYLKEKNITFRSDSTNLDNNYLRNKIRNKLIPFLNQEFIGWESAVLNGKERNSDTALFLQEYVAEKYLKLAEEKDDVVSFNKIEFLDMHTSVQVRLLLMAFNKLNLAIRIPYKFITSILDNKGGRIQYGDKFFQVLFKNDYVFVKKEINIHTDLAFFDIIKESGFYSFPFGVLNVYFEENTGKYKMEINENPIDYNFNLPICIRNAHSGDYIKSSNGEEKKVFDIFSDWHVGPELKELIPLVQDIKGQKLHCILGQFLGFKNWIVK